MSDVNTGGGESAAVEGSEGVGPAEGAGAGGNEGQSESDGSRGAAGKGIKESVAEQVRKFKLKVNGREREYDERMIQVLAQKGLAADEKFQMSASERKKAEKILKLAKEDPDAFIREARGEEPIEYYKNKIAEEIKRLSMDPKDREIAEYKKKLETYEKERELREKKEKEARLKDASDRFLSHYESELSKHIKASKLPATEQTIAYAAEILLSGIDDGIEPPMDVVMELVKERYINEYKSIVGSVTDDDLIGLLGEDTVKRILVANGKKAVSPVPREISKESQALGGEEEERKVKYESREDMDRRIREWAKRP